ncbi:D-Ala-D-Ala carboxypeptidase family metallohydrolase [Alkanindiges sp. WGS2144]|uniref:D-Ala-D-Ala carboxypeptidase family metallohydrolase n=1 Tax=Alkanindiges sp. WGS2144 TaxID=3366808 RepID=UPI00375318F3
MPQHTKAGDPRFHWLFLLCISPLLGSCTYQPVKTTNTPVQTPKPAQNQTLTLKTPPSELHIEHNVHWHRTAPQSYEQWLKQASHKEQVNRYYNYLIRHDVSNAAPIFELVKSARDWQRCGREPYAVPSSELWDNLTPTLKVLQDLQDRKILDNIEITSVYRDPELNQCANGSPGSKHVHNSALDFRIGSEQPDYNEQEKIARAKHQLCQYWKENGARLNMGLGVYASGQIHIDTQGFRTWGPDLTRHTSICPA